MKKSIFLFFAAILCATSAWGNTTFKAGEILFYDFSAITGGANWTWNNGSGMAYDAQAHKTVKAILFTADETWTKGKTIAKTGTGNWSGITFKDREDGTNCIKIGADGKSYTWTTHSIEEDILSGNYIMVYGGELNSWGQSEYWFLTEANDERKAAVAKTKLSITINSEAYKMGPVLLPAGSTSYIQGHWNSGMKCSVEAGSAYVVRNSTSKTNYTKKAQSGSDYLYQVKQNSTAPTKTLSPTCPTKILQGEKLSFSHGAAGVSVVGKTNTVKYYLQNGTTYTEKTLTDGTIDVSDLPAGNYSIITLLYDGYIYVKASTSNFTIESAYDVTFANDGNGTTNQTGTIKVGSSTGIVIDATPSTDYEFKAWESSNGGSFATTAADASNTFYPTANTTLTATFRSTAVNALLVVAGENITSVTGSAEPVALGNSYPISATFPAGYKFTTWTAEPAANATFVDEESATTDVTVLNGSVTITASAEEILSNLTTANEYNEGTPTIAAPTASVAKIGVTTTATVTAAAGTGYTFAGWKLDNCVRTDAGADNATTITVKSNGDGADAKVTAKYEQNVVYFVNTKGWSTVKVYAWNDGGASNAAWSGLALTAANVVKQIGGCDVYKYVPGDNYAKVIFNNGSEQTDDLTWQNGKYYVYNSENTKDVSDWYDESEVEGVLPDPVQLTYTVEVPAGTHECYIAGGMNGWSFTKMTPVDATHFTTTIQWATNADKYKYTSGPDWAYVEVKADGGEVADRTYNANDKVAKWSAVYDPSATVYDYYVVGTMNEWTQNDENYGMSKVGETTTYAKELTLAAGTYKFKVKGTAWYGYTDIIGEYTEISAEKDGEGNPTGNIQLTLAAEKTFTVNFDSNTKKISFTDLTEKVYKDIIITVKANETAPKIHWWNAGNKLNDSEWENLPKMTATANANEYSYTLKNVDAETGVEYLIKVGDLQSDNQKTKEDVTIDFRDICKVKVYGLNGWDKPYLLELADDYKTAKGTIVLEEKNYEFKMVEGSGDWLGNTGTIKKSESGWTFEKDKDNCKLQTKLAGNYIFTWDVTTNKLSVSYPVKVTPSVVENAYFSVADGEFVQFSTGNLQYEVGTNTWSFASKQYEVIGGEAYTGSNNTNFGMNEPGYTGKLDLFAWSCDGKFGVNPSNADADYTGEFADWGKLVNEEGWYTLTKDEMNYLLNRKKDGKKLWALATVCGMNGLILLPDNWNKETELEYGYVPADWNYTKNQFDGAAWAALEAAGAVFLPEGGTRVGGHGNKEQGGGPAEFDAHGDYFHVDNVGEMGYYWLNTQDTRTGFENCASYLILPGWSEGATDANEDDICLQPQVWSREKRRGNSVRLVKKVTPDSYYTRTVTSGDYGTICLPNGGLLLGASAFSVAKMEGTTILLDEVGTTMVGGTPYVVFPNTGATNLYVFYTDNANAPAGNVNGLYGSYTREELAPNAGNYIMLPGNKYAEVTGDRVFVAANRAYFKVSEIPPIAPAPAPGVRRIAIGQAPQVATGMENIDASAQPVKAIINGQLFILRGEKMYDAQGKLVK
ncbi:MAG: starch-binding protein [Paludibacteraceae bacterium]|nr:starch-binding protein [Paludibacteraceae bacterium]